LQFALCAFLPFGAKAEASTPTIYIPHVEKAPQFEDFIVGNPRESEAEVTDFRQWVPGDGTPSSKATKAYLAYDDKTLYVAFVADDDPAGIRAHKTKRDDILAEDYVCVNIDSFHDHRRDYFFCANPLGIQMDGITTDAVDDSSFDTLWYSQGQIVQNGFVVFIAIPFRSIRFPNVQSQSWGISLGRAITRSNETSFWPYITQRIPTFQTQFGHLEGLKSVSPGRNMQFIPYGIFAPSRVLDTRQPGAASVQKETNGRIGLDAKMVLRDSFTLDVALNPDFSQVESDEPQVAINRRYEIYFPEKRPLFIENAGFFVTPEQLFFSRRIADPEFGAKLTGKYKRWAVGVIAADDLGPGRVLPSSDLDFGRRAVDGIVRVAREFGSDSQIGIFASSSDFNQLSNRVFALDGRLRLTPNWYVEAQASLSNAVEASGAVSGEAYIAKLSHDDRHLSYHATYLDRSPGFRAELGFIPRIDLRQVQQGLSYTWRPSEKAVLSYGPRLNGLIDWDYAGRLQDWEVAPEFVVELKRITSIGVRYSKAFELFQNIGFSKQLGTVSLSSQSTSWLAWSSSFSQGTSLNYYPAAGLLPFSATSSDGAEGFTLRPSAQLTCDQTYLYSRLSTIPGSIQSRTDTPVIFTNHIFRTKTNYQFTRELSLRMILDYNAALPNSSLVALDKSKRFGGDVLLTYLIHPGTALYVGYTDIYENLRVAPVAPYVTRFGGPGTPVERQFFVKASYLFRM
jgi:hypothetical protein